LIVKHQTDDIQVQKIRENVETVKKEIVEI